MTIIKIPKRKGEFRTIYVPNAPERRVLNERLQKIKPVADGVNIVGGGVQHGFHAAHSPTTNALQHLNFQYTLTMDLKDFFDSVTPNMVPETIRFPECFPDGAARQGLPTSPALANIAACRMDKEICELLPQNHKSQPERRFSLIEGGFDSVVAYTRYADDLTFSSNTFDAVKFLMAVVPRIVERHGFKVNTSKTKVQWAGEGRRMITGVAVDSKLHAPRHTKRRLRAALHQRHTAEARGLGEWIKMRIPANYNAQRWATQPSHKPQSPTTAAQVKTVARDESVTRLFNFQHDHENYPTIKE